MTMPMPTKRHDDVVEEILRRISDGDPLATICASDKARFPTPMTWGVWVKDDETLAIAYARAREAGFDAIAAEAIEIMDAEPERVVTMMGDERSESRIDSASVQWAYRRAELRLKLLAKWDPKRYGDLMKLGNADGTNLPEPADQTAISVRAAAMLKEALSRDESD